MQTAKEKNYSSLIDMLYLFNAQMQLAASKRQSYYILNVQFDGRQMEGTAVAHYADPVSRIADGTFQNAQDKYVFRVA